MSRIPDGNAVSLDHLRDEAQVELIIVGRIRAAGMKQGKILPANDLDSVVYLLPRAHPGGHDDGPASGFPPRVAQELIIGHGGRADLEAGNLELIDEIH